MGFGRFILKIIWRKDDLKLSTGFVVGKDKREVIELKRVLEERIKKVPFAT